MDYFKSETLPIAEIGRKVGESARSIVVEIPDTEQVLKADKRIYFLERNPGESDTEYRQKRLDACMNYITKELTKERKAKKYLPEDMIAPTESHFIADGDDGFPAPFRIQKKVEGELLKNVPISELGPVQESEITALLAASLKCYEDTGYYLDIIGSSTESEYQRFRHLRKSLSPLKESVNIVLTKDGRIALVDVKLAHSSRVRDLLKYLILKAHYYKRLSDARHVNQSVFPTPQTT